MLRDVGPISLWLVRLAISVGVLALLALTPVHSEALALRTIMTVAGGGAGDGGPPTNANLYGATGIAPGGAGDLYLADYQNCRIRKVSGGTITTIAGNGLCAFGGDGGPATSANLYGPSGVAFDGAGNLYFADSYNCRIREVSGGTITTVAGNGTCAYGGDGGPAASASLNQPRSVTVDSAGNLYIADSSNCRVRAVVGGTITTVAGSGSCFYSGDFGPATASGVDPFQVALDGAGNLYIADNYNCRIRKVTGGTITTVAGNGACSYAGDTGPATSASLNKPQGVALDGSGDLYVADTTNCRIRTVSGSGTITTVAGNGSCTFGGDGGPATSAGLVSPLDVALDGAGNLYIGDGCRARQVSAGTMTTVAGDGSCWYGGDGGPATSASLHGPSGVALDGAGNLYIGDSYNCRVRKVNGGTITTVAGNGSCSYGGDGGPAKSASLNGSLGVALDGAGNLYIADTYNCRVRMVSASTITTIAGNGSCTDGGDGGSATNAGLNRPWGVAADDAGNVYVADTGNCRVRKVSGGIITTVAGKGSLFCTYGGDGGPAAWGELSAPNSVALDNAGNLYIADTGNCRIREVSGGMITTVAGNGTCTYGGDGGPATSAGLTNVFGVASDGAGNLYAADVRACRIREVSGGTVTTIAGNGSCAKSGDGGPALSASLAGPWSVAVDSSGNVFIGDATDRAVFPDYRVRELTAMSAGVGGIAELPDVRALPQATIGVGERFRMWWFAVAFLSLAFIVAISRYARRHRRR